MLLSRPIELLILLIVSRLLFQPRITEDSIHVYKLIPTPVQYDLYWNKTASSLHEFGHYIVNRRIEDGFE